MSEEEKKYKEKIMECKNKYQGRAHVGQQWNSSDEDEEPKKQGMATIAMTQGTFSPCLFNNFSDDEDNSHFCFMARGRKVQESSTSSSLTSSSIPSDDIDNLDEEEDLEAKMIKKFSKEAIRKSSGLWRNQRTKIST
jgi:hypothetical protein